MNKTIIALIVLLAFPFAVFAFERPTCAVYPEGHACEGQCIVNKLVDGVWVSQCEPVPVVEPIEEEVKGSSAGLFHILPRVAWINFNNGVIDWLATHFTIGKVICSTESHPFAINMYGQPFDGTPNSLDLGENYGYEILLNGDDGFWTYHRFEMPDWMFGTYYCRTISQTLIDTLTGNELVSQEIQIEL